MRKTLNILIVILCSLSLFFSACKSNDEDEKFWETDNYRIYCYEFLLQKLISNRNPDIVFVGDSLTNGGDFENQFSEKHCLNLGINGLTINNLRKLTNTIQYASPKKIFIMIGINSFLVKEGSLMEMLINYENMIKELESVLPNTKFYIESLLPISIANSDISNHAIQVFNNGLVSIATRYNADYINLYSLYEFNGGLNPLYTSDGTHLKTDAYQLWYDEVSKFF